jgi:hydrogenase maturation protease
MCHALLEIEGPPFLMRVIGVGNEFRGDDAVGLTVVRRLASKNRSDVETAMSDGDPAKLMDQWRNADRVVVVDASVSGSAHGAVRRFRAHEEPLPAGIASASSHGLGLATAIELSRAMGELPRELVVIVIEAETTAYGTGLSPAVAAAAERVVEEIVALAALPSR